MYILVISREARLRRLWVDNLTVRGYLAVGGAEIAQMERLVANRKPHVVIFGHIQKLHEADLRELREVEALASVPVILLSTDRPRSEWLKNWGIDVCFPATRNVSTLVKEMEAWLPVYTRSDE